MWHRRAQVEKVAVYPDPEDPARLLIELSYSVKATHARRSRVYPFYLIPGE